MHAHKQLLIKIPCFTDRHGTLFVIAWTGRLPFTPKPFSHICDVAGKARGAGHAHGLEA
jgi:hypothetical protein